jgi:phage-related protein
VSLEAKLTVKAIDEASKTLENVGKNVKQLGEEVEEVGSQTRKTKASARDLITGFSGLATSAFALYNAFDRVETSQVALDRANLQVKASLNAVEDAQRRYNAVVEKYGADSEQAQAAAKDLQLAQERYQIACEKANIAQGNVNQAIMHMALSVVPTLVTMVDSGVKAFQSFHAAIDMVNKAVAFLAANPLMAVIMAIGLVVGALITAYQTCEPFRNAINAIGEAIYNFFKPALDVIIGALTWLWDNILKPLGNFLVNVWIAQWNAVSSALYWFNNYIVKPLENALKWFWDNVLVPVGNFVRWIFVKYWEKLGEVWNILKGVWEALCNAVKWLWDTVLAPIANALKGFVDTIGGAVNTVKDALGGFAGAVSDAMGNAWNSISGFISNICFAHAIHNAVESSLKDLDKWERAVEASMAQGVESVKGFIAEVDKPTLAVGVGGAATPVPIPATASAVTVNITAPLVNVEGSADKRTVELAVEKVKQVLRTTLIEASSSAAPTKRIRVMGGVV